MENIAVALEYCAAEGVPKVLARGKGILAKSILDKAKEYNIPIYHDSDLATVLAVFDSGTYIPESLYQAVAVVFAYCYTVNNEFKKKIDFKCYNV